MRIISPSLLSANFQNISHDIDIVEDLGVNRLHLDVMDGYFVPNLTFGPMIIKDINKASSCHLETHLMIENPYKSLGQYINAGSNTIIVHIEACNEPLREIEYIKNNNVLAGIAINPDTDEYLLEPLLDYLDYILIMSVFPGKGGQKFISETINKMKNVVLMREGRDILIGVDGGVNIKTISDVYSTDIDIVIVGSGLFNANNISRRYQELMNA